MSSSKQAPRRTNWSDYPVQESSRGNDRSGMRGGRGGSRGGGSSRGGSNNGHYSRQETRDVSGDYYDDYDQFEEFMKFKNSSKNYNNNNNDNRQGQDSFCRHKPITKHLVVATLLDHFGDLPTCEYNKVTIKYHCAMCNRHVFYNVYGLGICYGSELLFVDFKPSKRIHQRETLLDYSQKKLPKEMLDQCRQYLRGDKKEEEAEAEEETEEEKPKKK